MDEISDAELIAIARRYGELLGPDALAHVTGYTRRHAQRVIGDPPASMNKKNRQLLIEALSSMVDEIEEAVAKRERQRELLRRAGVEAVDAGSRPGRGTGNNGGKNKKPEKDAG